MNPLTGLDVVRTSMITDIQIHEGEVRVTVDLPSTHQFARAIKEDIVEKVEPLWDVKTVGVRFSE
jgi:metal-sulfur cluster biosynthetic enzyme